MSNELYESLAIIGWVLFFIAILGCAHFQNSHRKLERQLSAWEKKQKKNRALALIGAMVHACAAVHHPLHKTLSKIQHVLAIHIRNGDVDILSKNVMFDQLYLMTADLYPEFEKMGVNELTKDFHVSQIGIFHEQHINDLITIFREFDHVTERIRALAQIERSYLPAHTDTDQTGQS